MLRLDWSAFVTDALLDDVAGAAGVRREDAVPLRDVVASILAGVGGAPFVERAPAEPERTDHARWLLEEALCRYLSAAAGARVEPGVELRGGGAEGPATLALSRERVPVNSASAAVLETLPGMAAGLAREWVRERERRGAYRSLAELVERVKGIGEKRGVALAGLLWFDDGRGLLAASSQPTGELAEDLRRALAATVAPSPPERLARAFRSVAAHVATAPHPATCQARSRSRPAGATVAEHPSEWTAVLDGRSYYDELPKLFAACVRSIDVCMFHVVAPTPAHPTHVLLDSLCAAHRRGAAVRVFLDRDSKRDPYHSTIVNSPSRRFLEQAGVSCRFDSTKRLMHSKFCVLDREIAVVGSHNWSAGSYFGFDDLSLAIRSPSLAAELTRRFDALWAEGR